MHSSWSPSQSAAALDGIPNRVVLRLFHVRVEQSQFEQWWAIGGFAVLGCTVLMSLIFRSIIVARTGHSWMLGSVWCLPALVGLGYAWPGLHVDITVLLILTGIASVVAGAFQLWLAQTRWPAERRLIDQPVRRRRRRRRRTASRARVRA